jgi:hypothetical protein
VNRAKAPIRASASNRLDGITSALSLGSSGRMSDVGLARFDNVEHHRRRESFGISSIPPRWWRS